MPTGCRPGRCCSAADVIVGKAKHPGYPRIVAVPGGRAARRGCRCVPMPRPITPGRWPAGGVLPAACRLARQLADYLRAISSYPSSQAMQAEASRFGTQRCRGRLILRGEALPPLADAGMQTRVK